MKAKVFLSCCILLTYLKLQAQTLLFPTTGYKTVAVCSGILYDDGGPDGMASTVVNGQLVLKPSSDSSVVQLTFEEFDLGVDASLPNQLDKVSVFDGQGSGSPLLGTFYAGQPKPTVFKANNINGTLTVVYSANRPNSTVKFAGFKASVSCAKRVFKPNINFIGSFGTSVPINVAKGSSIRYECPIENSGNDKAKNVSRRFYLSIDATYSNDDLFLKEDIFGEILPNNYVDYQSHWLTIPNWTSNGEYSIVCIVDYKNEIDEFVETDNSRSQKIVVQNNNFSLAVGSYLRSTPTVSHLLKGTNIKIEYEIQNLGNADMKNIVLRYYLSTNSSLEFSDMIVGQGIDSIYAGESYKSIRDTLFIPNSVANQQYYLFVWADATSKFSESNENDNILARSVTVSPEYVDFRTWFGGVIPQYPDTLTKGFSYYNSVQVLNDGNVNATNVEITYALSKDTVLDANDFKLLSKTFNIDKEWYIHTGAKLQLPYDATLPAGNYFLLMVVDPANKLQEPNENNNKKIFEVYVKSDYVYPVVSRGSSWVLQRSDTVRTCTGIVSFAGEFGFTIDYIDDLVVRSPDGGPIKLGFSKVYLNSTDSLFVFVDGILKRIYVNGEEPGEIVAPKGELKLALHLKLGNSYPPAKAKGFVATMACTDVLTGVQDLQALPETDGIGPNPVETKLYVRNAAYNSYQIMNAQGELVRIGSFEKDHSVNVEDLLKGVYILYLSHSDTKQMRAVKFVR